MRNRIKGYLKKVCIGRNKNIQAFSLTFILFLSFSSCTVNSPAYGPGANVIPPPWAPYYDNVNMIRYYYFPDIECYYDVWNREFVYLDDGSWMFGAMLPPSYAWYDLNTAFIVLLDNRVYEPWRHFHYYVSHYPRYYYRSYYTGRFEDATRPMRGFDENSRGTVYRNMQSPGERNRGEIIREEKRIEVNRPNQPEREVRPNREFPERRVEPTRPAERAEFHGKEIGKPVKVQRNMTRPHESKRR